MLGQKVVWGKVVRWVKIFYFEFSHFHLAIYKICSPLFPIFIVLRSPLGKTRTSVPSLWDLLENFKTRVEKGGVSISSGQQTNFQLQPIVLQRIPSNIQINKKNPIINPFVPDAPWLYPLKTSENLTIKYFL